MKLNIAKNTVNVETVVELRSHLSGHDKQFMDISLRVSDGFPVICALFNSEAAWLMYLQYDGDAGFSTRDPDYIGSEDDNIEYYLNNGQLDECPASWNIGKAQAITALEYFVDRADMLPSLQWERN